MFGRRRTTETDDDRDVIVEHGPSLAKGPAMLIGSVLMAFGLAALIRHNGFPSFSANFPDGTAHATNFLGFGVNGWTAWLTIVAGALLLFGSAQHHLAKTMSLVVGLGLIAASLIAFFDGGHDILGLGATNFLTRIGLLIAGGLSVLNALMPRTKRERVVGTGTRTGAAAPVATRRERVATEDRTTTGRDGVVEEPVEGRRFAREDQGAVTADDRTEVTDPRTRRP